MNKTALRNFSVQAKVKLLNAVKQKAYKFGITENEITPLTEGGVIDGRVLREEELKQYQQLVKRIETEGYERIMEEAAYTWFNRFIALRYMEVNDFLPIHLRILSSETEGKSEPDALTNITSLVDELDLDREFVYKMQDESNYEDLYQYLIVQQCNKLGEIIPNVFEYISDDMALLLPDNLLNENSVVRDVVTMVEEEDWKNVEVVGWLYQFYISEQKDELLSDRSKKIGKAEIGPVTQLFTPRWIVEYMVDNSLGRFWLESNPDDDLQKSIEYYLDDEEQMEEALTNRNINVESIKFLDPSCGSGHILVYAFELFHKIYLSRGYLEREIPQLILENNLFGLDIDTRATQLAAFAVVMKAREYDRRLFNREYSVHIHSVEESNSISEEELKTFAKDNKEVYAETQKLVNTFYDGKLYGSIIQVPEIKIEIIEEQIDYIQNEAEVDIFTAGILDFLVPLLEDLIAQYRVLDQKYEVVVTNPPYMNKYNADMKKYVNKYYKDYSKDLFSVFIYRNSLFCKEDGYSAFMTPMVWMFIISYEKLRKFIIKNNTVSSLVHLEYSAFEEATVPLCTFVLKNRKVNVEGSYIRLSDFRGGMEVQEEKYLEVIENPNIDYLYRFNQDNFGNIPGSPIAYWASDNVLDSFKTGDKLSDLITPKQGLATANNNRFLRFWWEIDFNKIKFDTKSVEESKTSGYKWVPYNKGGKRRQWYGNYDYVVNWENDGEEIRNFTDSNGKVRSRPQNTDYYFKEAITWPLITSGGISVRYRKSGSIHDVSGMSAFSEDKELLLYILGILSTNIADYIFKMLNPTLNLQVGDFNNFPVVNNRNDKNKVIELVENAIEIAENDWDTFETSWDYMKNPLIDIIKTSKEELVSNSFKLEDLYNIYKYKTNNHFEELKIIEQQLNREFIKVYNLQEDVSTKVSNRDITLTKIFDKSKEIDHEIRGNQYVLTKEDVVKHLLSYAVGCIFGRYSLDETGLAYAGGEWDASKYKTFHPVEDNIIPMTEDGYFEQDIVSKIESLLTIIYGEESLEENLHFIADALNKRKNETDRDRIRRYFTKEFFKDHSLIYQKRPIYWEFSSGRRGAFKGLMYLHRYDRDTVARFRTDYVLAESRTLDNLIMLEEHIVEDENSSTPQKARAEKTIENYQKDKKEVAEYAELLDHVARGRIELDLDDGVKVNYEKFQKIEIVDNQTGKVKKQDVLSKI